jgi:NTP pyrophosphatase (non-canonical NTP hydrolase)
MFARIYPNSLESAAMHFAEEVGEVSVALEYFMGMHEEKLIDEVVLELIDAITTIFAVATAIELDLAVEMEKQFAKGCPGCRRSPCECGFRPSSKNSYIG